MKTIARRNARSERSQALGRAQADTASDFRRDRRRRRRRLTKRRAGGRYTSARACVLQSYAEQRCALTPLPSWYILLLQSRRGASIAQNAACGEMLSLLLTLLAFPRVGANWRPGTTCTTFTLAGSGVAASVDGLGSGATINNPRGLVWDGFSGLLVFTEFGSSKIRRVHPVTGLVTTFAGSAVGFVNGVGSAAKFATAIGVAVNSSGFLFAADPGNGVIRLVAPSPPGSNFSAAVTVYAGSGGYGYADGAATSAQFYTPRGVALHPDGTLYVSEYNGNRIRIVSANGLTVSTLAGSGLQGWADGVGVRASFMWPTHLSFDGGSAGETPYLAVGDTLNQRVRLVTLDGVVSTLVGGNVKGSTDGIGTATLLDTPTGVSIVPSTPSTPRHVLISDSYGIHAVLFNGTSVLIAGGNTTGSVDGTGSNALFSGASCPAINGSGGIIFTTESSSNKIRGVVCSGDAPSSTPSPSPSPGAAAVSGSGSPSPTVTSSRTPTGTVGTVRCAVVSLSGMLSSAASSTDSSDPTLVRYLNAISVAVNQSGAVHALDQHRVRLLAPNGSTTTIAGSATAAMSDGVGLLARFSSPADACFCSPFESTGTLYIADTGNNRIRALFSNLSTITLGGNGTTQSVDGNVTTSRFFTPSSIACTATGALVVGELFRLRLVTRSSNGAWGQTSTIAGGPMGLADGYGTSALFNWIRGVTVRPGTDTIYAADSGNHRIVVVNPTSGLVLTLAGGASQSMFGSADGPGWSALFYSPVGLAFDSSDTLYVADNSNSRIRTVSMAGVVNTVAGAGSSLNPSPPVNVLAPAIDGPALGVRVNYPLRLAWNGSSIVFSELSVLRALSCQQMPSVSVGASPTRSPTPTPSRTATATSVGVSPLNCLVTTLAGNGSAWSINNANPLLAAFNAPYAVKYGPSGTLYVSENGGHRVRSISPSGVVATVAGRGIASFVTGVPPLAVGLNAPRGLFIDASENIYCADYGNHRIRLIQSGSFQVSVVAGTGTAGYAEGDALVFASFNGPSDVVIDSVGALYVVDSNNRRIRMLNTTTGIVSTVAGNSITASIDGVGVGASFVLPVSIVLGPPASRTAYVSDSFNMRTVQLDTGLVNTLAGSITAGAIDGVGPLASFNYPKIAALDDAGALLVVPESVNSRLRICTVATSECTKLAGSGVTGSADGVGTAASFSKPYSVAAVAGSGGTAWAVADFAANLIRVLSCSTSFSVASPTFSTRPMPSPSRSPFPGACVVSTLWGAANRSASFTGRGLQSPNGIAVGASGTVYVSEIFGLSTASANRIRAISPSGSTISNFAGLSGFGQTDGVGTNALFQYPRQIVLTSDEATLYVADDNSCKIRGVLTASATSFTVAGAGGTGSNDGLCPTAKFNFPYGLALSPDNSRLAVADTFASTIRIITLSPCSVVTIAGVYNTFGYKDGVGSNSLFNAPVGITWHPTNNLIYVSDKYFVRSVTPTGVTATIAGSSFSNWADGFGAMASFTYPRGLAIDSQNNILVADQYYLRSISPSGVVSTLAGISISTPPAPDGPSTLARLGDLVQVAIAPSGDILLADMSNNAVRVVRCAASSAPSVVPSPLSPRSASAWVTPTPTPTLSPFSCGSTVYMGSGTVGFSAPQTIGTSATFSAPSSFQPFSFRGTFPGWLIADTNNHAIRFAFSNYTIRTLAGLTPTATAGSADGVGTAASFNGPSDAVPDPLSPGAAYIADTNNCEIRYMDKDLTVTTISGSACGFADGPFATSRFNLPTGIDVSPDSSVVYVMDSGNDRVRSLNLSSGLVTTLAGNGGSAITDGVGAAASFLATVGLSVTPSGDLLIVDSNSVRRVGMPGANVQTIAGSAASGYVDGVGTAAMFSAPRYAVERADGSVLVADTGNGVVRIVTNAGGQTFTVRTLWPTSGGTVFPRTLLPMSTASFWVGEGIPSTRNCFRLVTCTAVSPTPSPTFGGMPTPSPTQTPTALSTPSPTPSATTTGCIVRTWAGTLNFPGSSGGPLLSSTLFSPVALCVDNSERVWFLDIQANGGGVLRVASAAAGVQTVAGSGNVGSADGALLSSSFNSPLGLDVTSDGSVAYIADTGNCEIRVVSSTAVSTLAGSGAAGYADAVGTSASFSAPVALALDSKTAPSQLYVCDRGNHVIRVVRIATGATTTLVGKAGLAGYFDATGLLARFSSPSGIAVSSAGLLVTESGGHRLRLVTLPSLSVSTFAGCGSAMNLDGVPGTAACFASPMGVVARSDGSALVTTGVSIRAVGANGASITTFANTAFAVGFVNGGAAAARFNASTARPLGVAEGNAGTVYVADPLNRVIRAITCASSVLLSATPTPTASASPSTGAASQSATVSASPATGAACVVSTVAGSGFVGTVGFQDGVGWRTAQFNNPVAGAWDQDTRILYLMDKSNYRIRSLNSDTQIVSTLAGGPFFTNAVDAPVGGGVAMNFVTAGGAAVLDNATPKNLYFTDYNNNRVRAVSTLTGATTTLSGSSVSGYLDAAVGSVARLLNPYALAIDVNTNVLFLSDRGNFRIRTINISSNGATGTLAGSGTAGLSDGVGTSASFQFPCGVALSGSSFTGALFVVERTAGVIRRIALATRTVMTIAGSAVGYADGPAAGALFNLPEGATVDAALGALVITETTAGRVRALFLSSMTVTTLAGSNAALAFADGSGMSAILKNPGLPISIRNGSFYIPDGNTHVVRLVTCAGFSSATPSPTPMMPSPSASSARPACSVSTLAAMPGNTFAVDMYNSSHLLFSVQSAVYTLPFSTVATAIPSMLVGAAGGGSQDGWLASAQTTYVSDIAVNPKTGAIAFVDNTYGNVRLLVNGTLTTLAGPRTLRTGFDDGFGAAALFNLPKGIAFEPSGSLLVTDSANNVIRRVTDIGYVYTVAGSGVAGSADGFGLLATLNGPIAITVDASTGDAYFTETGRIRVMTAHFIVKTIAGGATATSTLDGVGTAATFGNPAGISLDGNGGLFVTDYALNRIRYINIATSTVTSLAGSNTAGTRDGVSALFSGPRNIKVLPGGSSALLTDFTSKLVRLFSCPYAPSSSFAPPPTTTTATIPLPVVQCATTILAGGGAPFNVTATPGFLDGAPAVALFSSPAGLALDTSEGVVIYVADAANHAIRSVNLSAGGVVATVAGRGGSSYGAIDSPWPLQAQFYSPLALTALGYGWLLVADTSNHIIRLVPTRSAARGGVSTLAGTTTAGVNDGEGDEVQFNAPAGIFCCDEPVGAPVSLRSPPVSGFAFVADTGNHLLRGLTLRGRVTTLAGKAGVDASVDGDNVTASFSSPRGLALDATARVLYVADSNALRAVFLAPTAGVVLSVSTLAGTGDSARVDADVGALASFTSAWALALTPMRESLVLVEPAPSAVRRVSLSTGATKTLAGGVPVFAPGADLTILNTLRGIVALPDGTFAVAAGGSNTILKLSCASASPTATPQPSASPTPTATWTATSSSGIKCATTLLAGSGSPIAVDGYGASAALAGPGGIIFASGEGAVYFSDTPAHVLRRVFLAAPNRVETVAGSPSSPGCANGPGNVALFNTPEQITLSGTAVFIADRLCHRVRVMNATTREVSTLTGTGVAGYADGPRFSAQFSQPVGIAASADGTLLFVSDSVNRRIRQVVILTGAVTTLSGRGDIGADDGQAAVATFNSPMYVTADSSGLIYVADALVSLVRVVNASTGAVSTIAATSFSAPNAVTVDMSTSSGALFVADPGRNSLLRVSLSGVTSATVGPLNYPPRSVASAMLGANGTGAGSTSWVVASSGPSLVLVVCPSATATATPSPSVTPSATATLSPGASASKSPSQTVTPTPTGTGSNTPSATASVTATPTPTAGLTFLSTTGGMSFSSSATYIAPPGGCLASVSLRGGAGGGANCNPAWGGQGADIRFSFWSDGVVPFRVVLGTGGAGSSGFGAAGGGASAVVLLDGTTGLPMSLLAVAGGGGGGASVEAAAAGSPCNYTGFNGGSAGSLLSVAEGGVGGGAGLGATHMMPGAAGVVIGDAPPNSTLPGAGGAPLSGSAAASGAWWSVLGVGGSGGAGGVARRCVTPLAGGTGFAAGGASCKDGSAGGGGGGGFYGGGGGAFGNDTFTAIGISTSGSGGGGSSFLNYSAARGVVLFGAATAVSNRGGLAGVQGAQDGGTAGGASLLSCAPVKRIAPNTSTPVSLNPGVYLGPPPNGCNLTLSIAGGGGGSRNWAAGGAGGAYATPGGGGAVFDFSFAASPTNPFYVSLIASGGGTTGGSSTGAGGATAVSHDGVSLLAVAAGGGGPP